MSPLRRDTPAACRSATTTTSSTFVENQLLRTAADFLLRFPTIPPAARKRLRKIRATLIDVSLLRICPIRADVPVKSRGLNARYEAPLALASTDSASRASIDSRRAAVLRSIGFVFDMNQGLRGFPLHRSDPRPPPLWRPGSASVPSRVPRSRLRGPTRQRLQPEAGHQLVAGRVLVERFSTPSTSASTDAALPKCRRLPDARLLHCL